MATTGMIVSSFVDIQNDLQNSNPMEKVKENMLKMLVAVWKTIFRIIDNRGSDKPNAKMVG